VTPPPALERVTLGASPLLGVWRRYLIAAAALGCCTAFWSTWIVSEFVRRRTEWIADRAAREGCDRAEVRRQLREPRQRANALIDALSHILQPVDYSVTHCTRTSPGSPIRMIGPLCKQH